MGEKTDSTIEAAIDDDHDEDDEAVVRSPVIIVGDKLEPTPHILNFVTLLKQENAGRAPDEQIRYVVCESYPDIALAIRDFKDNVRMMMVGPGLDGKAETVALLLSRYAKTIVVVDPRVRPLSSDPKNAGAIRERIEGLGNFLVHAEQATADFFEPIVEEFVVSSIPPQIDAAKMTPEERRGLLDERLDGVNKFPSLPDTQKRVAALDDMDPPKKWAAAIDSDLPTKTVILRLLNSAHYSFRSRVETIEHAVALASAKAIRGIVLACTVQRLFHKISAGRIEQFWKHAATAAFFAKLFATPADPGVQTPQQKSEFVRFKLESEQREHLQELRIWERVTLTDEDGDPFTAGLLHDIGKICMAMCFEDVLLLIDPIIEAEFEEAARDKRIWARSARSIERLLMRDIDHQIIGARVSERWELDPRMRHAIAFHHNVQSGTPALTRVVALADLAANLSSPYPCGVKQHPLTRLAATMKKEIERLRPEDRPDALDELIEDRLGDDFDAVFAGLEVPQSIWDIVPRAEFIKLAFSLGPQITSSARTFLRLTGSS